MDSGSAFILEWRHIHGFLVHFPVALGITAFFAEIISVTSVNIVWRDLARRLLIVAMITATLSAIVGLIAAAFLSESVSASKENTLSVHRLLGLLTASGYVLCVFGNARRNQSPQTKSRVALYWLALVTTVTLTTLAAAWGSSLSDIVRSK